MSYYPTPNERRDQAKRTIERWRKIFPTPIVRRLVQDAHATQRSKEKREVYTAWLASNPVNEEKELAEITRYFSLDVPRIRLVEVHGPAPTEDITSVEDFKNFLFDPEWKEEYTTMEDVEDGIIEYVVNPKIAYIVNKGRCIE